MWMTHLKELYVRSSPVVMVVEACMLILALRNCQKRATVGGKKVVLVKKAPGPFHSTHGSKTKTGCGVGV